MTPAYINVVLETYKLKRLEKALRSELYNPTRANIKKCCLNNCIENYNRKDGRILKDFFGEGDEKELLLQKIKRTDPEDYRTVQNFLREETTTPRENPVELAAWLIDFTPRPYDEIFDYDLLLEQTRQAITNWGGKKQVENVRPVFVGGEEGDDVEKKVEPDPEPPQGPGPSGPVELPGSTNRGRTWIWVTTFTVLAIITGFVSYNYWPSKLTTDTQLALTSPVRPTDCMIWSVDHYEKIPCDHRYNDSLAIPFDSVVLRKFKKITNPESISIEDLERVWYSKYNNKVEYFTDSGLGLHPVNNRPLKRLSERIYIAHILPLRDSLSQR